MKITKKRPGIKTRTGQRVYNSKLGTKKHQSFNSFSTKSGDPLPTIEELNQIARLRDTLEKNQDPTGILVPHADLKVFLSCLFGLLWLEQPQAEPFKQNAQYLIDKYRPFTRGIKNG